jgi:hypothetical protein
MVVPSRVRGVSASFPVPQKDFVTPYRPELAVIGEGEMGDRESVAAA